MTFRFSADINMLRSEERHRWLSATTQAAQDQILDELMSQHTWDTDAGVQFSQADEFREFLRVRLPWTVEHNPAFECYDLQVRVDAERLWEEWERRAVRIPVGGSIEDYRQGLYENPETYLELMTGSFASDVGAAAAHRQQEAVIAEFQSRMVRPLGLPPEMILISTPPGPDWVQTQWRTNWSYASSEPHARFELENYPLPKDLEGQPLLFIDEDDSENPRALFLQPMDEPGHYLVFLNTRLIPGVFRVQSHQMLFTTDDISLALVGEPNPKQINIISLFRHSNGRLNLQARTGTGLTDIHWQNLRT